MPDLNSMRELRRRLILKLDEHDLSTSAQARPRCSMTGSHHPAPVLILDLVIEAAIRQTASACPCWSAILPSLAAPHQAAADGGYANRHNFSQAKARGVNDTAFHKKAGLRSCPPPHASAPFRARRLLSACEETHERLLCQRAARTPALVGLPFNPSWPGSKTLLRFSCLLCGRRRRGLGDFAFRLRRSLRFRHCGSLLRGVCVRLTRGGAAPPSTAMLLRSASMMLTTLLGREGCSAPLPASRPAWRE